MLIHFKFTIRYSQFCCPFPSLATKRVCFRCLLPWKCLLLCLPQLLVLWKSSKTNQTTTTTATTLLVANQSSPRTVIVPTLMLQKRLSQRKMMMIPSWNLTENWILVPKSPSRNSLRKIKWERLFPFVFECFFTPFGFAAVFLMKDFSFVFKGWREFEKMEGATSGQCWYVFRWRWCFVFLFNSFKFFFTNSIFIISPR